MYMRSVQCNLVPKPKVSNERVGFKVKVVHPETKLCTRGFVSIVFSDRDQGSLAVEASTFPGIIPGMSLPVTALMEEIFWDTLLDPSIYTLWSVARYQFRSEIAAKKAACRNLPVVRLPRLQARHLMKTKEKMSRFSLDTENYRAVIMRYESGLQSRDVVLTLELVSAGHPLYRDWRHNGQSIVVRWSEGNSGYYHKLTAEGRFIVYLKQMLIPTGSAKFA